MSRSAWARVADVEMELAALTRRLDAALTRLDATLSRLDAVRTAHTRWVRCEITTTEFGDAIATALEAPP